MDSGAASHQDDLADGRFVHLGVLQRLLHGVQGTFEQVSAEFFESCSCNGGVEVVSIEKRVGFDVGLSGCAESSLGTFASCSQSSESSFVSSDVFLLLPGDLLDEVVHHPVVEVLSSEMSVSSSRLYSEDTVIHSEDGHVESTTSKIEDEDIRLPSSLALLVQTISNSSSCRFIDNPQNIETSNDASILSRLSLSVVKVGGDRDNGVGDISTEES